VIQQCEGAPRYQLSDFGQTWIEAHGAGVKLMTRYKIEGGETFDMWIGHWPYKMSHIEAFLRHREGVLDRIHFQSRRYRGHSQN